MAKVFNIKYLNISRPFNTNYTTFTYNNELYIHTRNAIYKYDTVNNLYTLVLNKSITTDNRGVLVGDYFYTFIMAKPSGSSYYALYIYKYDVINNIFNTTEVIRKNQVIIGQGAIGCPYVNDNKIYFQITENTGFASYNNVGRLYIYDTINNTITENGNGTSPITALYTIYYYNQLVSNISFSFFYYSYVSNDFKQNKIIDTATCGYTFATKNTFLNTKNIINQYNYASFAYGDDIYIIGGTDENNELIHDIIKYNKTSNSFTKFGTIDIDVNGYWAGTIDNERFYIFGTDKIAVLEFINYNLNYKIANNSGDNVYVELTEQSPITKIRFNYNFGDSQVGYVFSTLSGDIVGTYTPNIPDGYKLIGFGYSPNASSSSVIGPLNTDISVSIDSDFTFYEVYGIYRPPGTTFDINLYQNTSEGNRVDKTNYLTQVGTISGALRSSTSINDLVITYESKLIPNFNYVYIPIFNRYYFVDDITSENYSLWTLALSVDPLMTYKEAIINCNGFVDRCESDFNANIIDKKRVVEEGNTIEVDTVTNELFTNTSGTYIMTALLVGFDNIEG